MSFASFFVQGITKIDTLIFCSQVPESTLTLVFLLQPCAHTFDSATKTFTALKRVFRAGTFLYFSEPRKIQYKKVPALQTLLRAVPFLGTISGACTKLQ